MGIMQHVFGLRKGEAVYQLHAFLFLLSSLVQKFQRPIFHSGRADSYSGPVRLPESFQNAEEEVMVKIGHFLEYAGRPPRRILA